MSNSINKRNSTLQTKTYFYSVYTCNIVFKTYLALRALGAEGRVVLGLAEGVQRLGPEERVVELLAAARLAAVLAGRALLLHRHLPDQRR